MARFILGGRSVPVQSHKHVMDNVSVRCQKAHREQTGGGRSLRTHTRSKGPDRNRQKTPATGAESPGFGISGRLQLFTGVGAIRRAGSKGEIVETSNFYCHSGKAGGSPSKELEILRIFLSFCVDRGKARENAAKKIKMPRNLKPNDIVPFTPAKMTKILAACDNHGRSAYERLRARAIVLTLRYTALRIGDISMLARDRISHDGERWRIYLRTAKSGQPVFPPVPPDMKAAFDAVPVLIRNGASRHLFWNKQGTPQTHKAHVDRSPRAVFKAAGVANAHAHRFRHTLATELLGRGTSFEDIADILTIVPKSFVGITASGQLLAKTA